MIIYYYQFEGKTFRPGLDGGAVPQKNSPIWKNPNTCVWMVPGTQEDEF